LLVEDLRHTPGLDYQLLEAVGDFLLGRHVASLGFALDAADSSTRLDNT
jgi:hypothetical protein